MDGGGCLVVMEEREAKAAEKAVAVAVATAVVIRRR